MDLRAFRASDLDTLVEIDQACFPPGVSYSRSQLASFISHRESRTWVAVEGEEVVGFLIADRQPQRVGHIITIDVRQGRRRRGVGKALMDAAEHWARGQDLRLVYLETAEDNQPAQRFYRSRGYEKTDRIEHYYGNGEAAWVMVKWLEPRESAR